MHAATSLARAMCRGCKHDIGDRKRDIVETKGQEDVNVANKDRAAAIWCDNASTLTGEVGRT